MSDRAQLIGSQGAATQACTRIGGWVLDPALNQLRRGEQVEHLEPKAVTLLLELALEPGAVLSRETLLQRVWPGLVVSDDVLTQVVTKLRRALGDSPRQPSYIATIPKRGYRLLAEVAAVDGDAPGGAPPPASLTSPAPLESGAAAETPRPATDVRGTGRGSRSRRGWLAIAMSLPLIALAAWLWWPNQEVTPALGGDAQPLVEVDPGATLLVEPFNALISGQSQLDMARGITADLITDLVHVDGLWVLTGPVPEHSVAAAPRYRVIGSVQHDDKGVRVHARLIDGRDGRQLWARRYDRPITDLFRVQAEISTDLTRALSRKVSEAEQRRRARRYTRNLEAWRLFQRARSELLVRGHEANDRARALYRRAVELDPGFARAYAGLALTFAADYRNQWVGDGKAALDRAQRTAQTAAGIDPDIAEIDWVLAYVHAQRREHDAAVERLQKALRVHRSFADGYALLGGVETYRGNPARSVSLLRTAMRLRPDAGHLYYLLLGRAYYFLSDLEQAELNLRQALARNPENEEAHIYLAAVLNEQGRSEDAAWQLEEVRGLDPDFKPGQWLRTYPMTDQAQLRRLWLALGVPPGGAG